MRVVPIRSGLIGDIEVVQEPTIRRDRALAHKCRAVCVACVALGDTVPMLETMFRESSNLKDVRV